MCRDTSCNLLYPPLLYSPLFPFFTSRMPRKMRLVFRHRPPGQIRGRLWGIRLHTTASLACLLSILMTLLRKRRLHGIYDRPYVLLLLLLLLGLLLLCHRRGRAEFVPLSLVNDSPTRQFSHAAFTSMGESMTAASMIQSNDQGAARSGQWVGV